MFSLKVSRASDWPGTALMQQIHKKLILGLYSVPSATICYNEHIPTLHLFLRISLDEQWNVMSHIPYSEKLSREKTFHKFHGFCGYSRKFSLLNLGVWHPLVWQKYKQFAKVFSTKIVHFTNSQKFSSSKVSHYSVFLF